MPVPKICRGCGIAFTVTPSRARRHGGQFHNAACYYASMLTKRPGRDPDRKLYTDRFWSKIVCDLATGCWLWTGSVTGFGYGQFGMGGRGGRRVDTHRLSWMMHHGNHPCMREPMLPGLCVLHHCDTPACVRPEHLYVGTKKRNALDRIARNRGGLGETNGMHKLTASQVLEIRRLCDAGVSRVLVAEQFAVSYMTVARIHRRQLWKLT